MITRSSIAFEDFLGSSIAPQVIPPWKVIMMVVKMYWNVFFFTSQFLMRNNHLGKVVVQELADPVAEEAVGEHVRDLLQVLRLDGTHVANIFLIQNVEGCS